jgi:hypothetical protein
MIQDGIKRERDWYMWKYLNPNMPHGMAVIATICCGFLGYLTFQKSGSLDEIWANRCLIAQKEWKQLALFDELDHQSRAQKSNPLLNTLAPPQPNTAVDLKQTSLQYFYLNKPTKLAMPVIDFQSLHLDLRKEHLLRLKLSHPHFDWIYEKFKSSQVLINQELEALLGRPGNWIEAVFHQPTVTAFELESIEPQPVTTLTCQGQLAKSEIIQLLQAMRTQRIGLLDRQNTKDQLIELRGFENSLERRVLLKPTQDGWDQSISWFTEQQHPSLSKKLDLSDLQIIDQPIQWASVEALIAELAQNAKPSRQKLDALLQKIKLDFPQLQINIQD